MAIVEKLKFFENRHPLGVWGLLLAFAFGWPAYYNFFKDTHPQLYFDILSDTSVLEIKEELPKLEIKYGGVDIRQQKLTLRIYRLSIVNDSSIDIRTSDYDLKAPIGLEIDNGKIISSEVIDTSNDYLGKYLTIFTNDEQKLHFSDVIIDAHQSFTLKLLVLHPEDAEPMIKPLGHIAGMKQIPVQDYAIRVATKSAKYWFDMAMKIASYFMYFIGAILLISIAVALFEDWRDKRKRRLLIRKYKGQTRLPISKQCEFMLNEYLQGNLSDVEKAYSIIEDEETLELAGAEYEKINKRLDGGKDSEHSAFRYYYIPLENGPTIDSTSLGYLIENDLIVKQEGKWKQDPNVLKTMSDIISFFTPNEKGGDASDN